MPYFFIKAIPLVTLQKSIFRCLKVSFSLKNIPKRFLIRHFCHLNIIKTYEWMNQYFLFPWKQTSWDLGYGLKSIFQLRAYFEIKEWSLLRALPLSFFIFDKSKQRGGMSKMFCIGLYSIVWIINIERKRSAPKSDPWGTPDKIIKCLKNFMSDC